MKFEGNMGFTINDFSQINSGFWTDFKVNKDVIIFDKLVKKERFELTARLINDITEYIPNINNYLQWLGKNCKDDLISTFYEIINSLNENDEHITLNHISEINWYDELKIFKVTLYLSESGLCSGARIYCIDNFFKNNIIEFHTSEYNIELTLHDLYCYKMFEIPVEEERIEKYLKNKNIKTIKNDIKEKYKIICQIHNAVMVKKEIPIGYGLPIGPVFGYTEEREKSFPNCDDSLLGGCCVDEDSPTFELNYVCDMCNEAREEWKINHRSEIFFELNRNIKENIILLLNDKIKLTITKNNAHDNYWVKIIAIPNGKYNIKAMDKLTKKIYAYYEITLKNEILRLNIERENNQIIFKLDYKNKMDAYWY
jgi:hypothetical protein